MSEMTNAALARQLTGLAKIVAQERDYLAEGMWNPNFCSADAVGSAEDVCDALSRRIAHIRKLCLVARLPAPPSPSEHGPVTFDDDSKLYETVANGRALVSRNCSEWWDKGSPEPGGSPSGGES